MLLFAWNEELSFLDDEGIQKILHKIQHSSLNIELKRKMLYKRQDFPEFKLLSWAIVVFDTTNLTNSLISMNPSCNTYNISKLSRDWTLHN